jgi:AcrR family transcriptional regulator
MRTVPSRAERQAHTRTALVDAAERLFIAQGFHATPLDSVAAEAGYTKGAVYSNFASKEDLFFAVYERRLDARVAEFEEIIEAAPTARDALHAAAMTAAPRTERGDGWLAVFFEFWAHVLRHPELRARFLALHAAAREPVVDAMRRMDIGGVDPERWTITGFALVTGIALEQLTDPTLDGDAMITEAMQLTLAGARMGHGTT